MEALLRYQLLADDHNRQVPVLSEMTHGSAALTVPRIGQQAFKAVVAETYNHHCAITGDKVRPVLEAAHILPVAAGGVHRVDNGLLLRSDVHTLFDRGFISVDVNHRLRVSRMLRERSGTGFTSAKVFGSICPSVVQTVPQASSSSGPTTKCFSRPRNERIQTDHRATGARRYVRLSLRSSMPAP